MNVKSELPAELVERRTLAARNTNQTAVTATQCAGETLSGLARVREAAKRDKKLRFNNLLHHITPELLHEAYFELKRNAASGVDKVRWRDYGDENLIRKLRALHQCVHNRSYKPQPSKRVWITKDDGRQRPIGITSLEDKIVQQALVWVLQEIFETDFLGFSYGFRPERNQHRALDAVYVALTQKKVSWVLDADIKGFYDTIDQEWLMMFLSERVADKRVLDLCVKMLRAGVIEEGQKYKTDVGTAQGSVISPFFANVFLHLTRTLRTATKTNEGHCGQPQKLVAQTPVIKYTYPTFLVHCGVVENAKAKARAGVFRYHSKLSYCGPVCAP